MGWICLAEGVRKSIIWQHTLQQSCKTKCANSRLEHSIFLLLEHMPRQTAQPKEEYISDTDCCT